MEVLKLGKPVADDITRLRFETLLAANLDAAHNLARWLIRDPHDAEDCLQDACMRALRFFDGFRGGDGRAWLLTIVRNTCYTWMQRHRAHGATLEYNDDAASLSVYEAGETPPYGEDPALSLLRDLDAQRLEDAIRSLPAEYTEVLILREMEDLPYKQIADIVGVPVGTVMSRLSRARVRLRECLHAQEVARHAPPTPASATRTGAAS